MKERTDKNRQPLPPVVDTMPGRELRTTYVDRKTYAMSTGFYGVYPHSPLVDREEIELPY